MSRPRQHDGNEEARLGRGRDPGCCDRARSAAAAVIAMVHCSRSRRHPPVSSDAVADLRKARCAVPLHADLQPLRRRSRSALRCHARRLARGETNPPMRPMDACGDLRSRTSLIKATEQRRAGTRSGRSSSASVLTSEGCQLAARSVFAIRSQRGCQVRTAPGGSLSIPRSAGRHRPASRPLRSHSS